MLAKPVTRQVQWQDLKVRSEADVVFELAQQKGWKDCEIFGQGDMITQPLESKGWKLIPADIYEYSIPAAGISRVLEIVNAGVRIKGVIIADDQRRTEPEPAEPKPLLPKVSLPKVSLAPAAKFLSFIGKALLGLMMVAGMAALVVGFALFAPISIVGLVLLFLISGGTEFDPKLIILVEDENGGTVWISVLTWYD